MEKSERFNHHMKAGKSDRAGVDAGPHAGCGIDQEQFPRIGKCCQKINNDSFIAYSKACEYCNIWSSSPVGVNPAVSHLFKCAVYEYRKQISR
jgi:hypothetical protein